jgi:predicted MPP superfamily phosphohydrolase
LKKHRFSRREFLKLGLGSLLGASALGLGGYEYASFIEPNWVEISHLKLTLPRLPVEFDGFRLVQISDIHQDRWMTPERIAHIVHTVNRLKPDCVTITGDFVTREVDIRYEHMVASLSDLSAKEARLAVLGNHDHWSDPDLVRQIIRHSGLTNISNSTLTLERGEARLHFAGVDDYWERQDDLDLVLQQLPESGCAILLAHEPDYADISAPTGRFDLQLSGHSHGGQVVIPFMGPPVLPSYGKKYPLGLYQVGEMLLYTNRGLGMIFPRVRFNCRPEITVFTLQAPH